MPERWLPVVGFEGRYEVSDLGNVRTTRRWTRNRFSGYWRYPRPVTQHRQHSGHLRVYLYPDAERVVRHQGLLVHRLVLTAFVGECPEGHEGCHRDGSPPNNYLENLYWGTPSDNRLDSIRHGTHNSIAKARRTHCRRGHEFTPENTHIVTSRGGARLCIACRRYRDNRRAASKRKASV